MPRKSGKSKGGKKRGKGGKDPVTGRTVEVLQDGRLVAFQDDVVYEIIDGDPNTILDDIITPLGSIPLGAPPVGANYTQLQFGDDYIVQNNYYADGTQQRSASFGSVYYSKRGEMTRASIASAGMIQKSDRIPEALFGNIDEYPQRWNFASEQIFSINRPEPTNIAGYSWTSSNEESGGGLAAIRAFGGGKFFFEGWQNNLFDTSLV